MMKLGRPARNGGVGSRRHFGRATLLQRYVRMARRPGSSGISSSRSSGWSCALVLLVALASPSAAQSPAMEVVSARPVAVSAPLWGDFRSITKALQAQLGTPRRLGQLAVIGICLGLYILMRR